LCPELGKKVRPWGRIRVFCQGATRRGTWARLRSTKLIETLLRSRLTLRSCVADSPRAAMVPLSIKSFEPEALAFHAFLSSSGGGGQFQSLCGLIQNDEPYAAIDSERGTTTLRPSSEKV